MTDQRSIKHDRDGIAYAKEEILQKSLGPEFIANRVGPGNAKLFYIEGRTAINLANEVFGYDGWSSEVLETVTDFIDVDDRGRVSLGIAARVRVTLKCGTYHEDWGYGSFENAKTKADAFEKARKESVTDGLKRALRLFGDVMGNCIYDKNYLRNIGNMAKPAIPFSPKDLYRHPAIQKGINERETARAQSTSASTASPVKRQQTKLPTEPSAKVKAEPPSHKKTHPPAPPPLKRHEELHAQSSFVIDEDEDDDIYDQIEDSLYTKMAEDMVKENNEIPLSPTPPAPPSWKRQRKNE